MFSLTFVIVFMIYFKCRLGACPEKFYTKEFGMNKAMFFHWGRS